MKKSRLRQLVKKHTRKSGPRCSVCALPASVLKLIREANAEGVGSRVLAECLQEEGFMIRKHSVRDHFLFHDTGR